MFVHRVLAASEHRSGAITFLLEHDIRKNRDYILVKNPLRTGYDVLRFVTQEQATIFTLWLPQND